MINNWKFAAENTYPKDGTEFLGCWRYADLNDELQWMYDVVYWNAELEQVCAKDLVQLPDGKLSPRVVNGMLLFQEIQPPTKDPKDYVLPGYEKYKNEHK
ncbi:hypothetical protein [Microcystis phage Mel-JY01]